MTEFERYVRRLRQEPGLSRNRHFDELSLPDAHRARRLLQRFAGLARELKKGSSVEVKPVIRRDGDEGPDGGYVVTIYFADVRARHQAFLTAEEHALLLLDENLAAHLGPRVTEREPPLLPLSAED